MPGPRTSDPATAASPNSITLASFPCIFTVNAFYTGSPIYSTKEEISTFLGWDSQPMGCGYRSGSPLRTDSSGNLVRGENVNSGQIKNEDM